jgi:hypothetical protein
VISRASGPVFGSTEGVGSRFHVLISRTHFRQYKGCRVSISCGALLYSFSAVPRASCSVFMFCAPRLIFGGTEGVGSRFHILRSWTHFRRYRVRQVRFSCFACLDSFSTVPIFSAPGHVFGGAEGVGSCSHVLRSRIRFCRYRGRWVRFSHFALPDSFSAVSRASGPVFMFCAPELVSDDTEVVGTRFPTLRSRTSFRRYRGRRARFHVLRAWNNFRR